MMHYTRSIHLLAFTFLLTPLSFGEAAPIPTNKKGIENAAATAKEALKPAAHQLDPARSKRIARFHKLAAAAQQSTTQFHRNLASGKAQPWQHLRQQFTEIKKSIPSLETTRNQILSENNPLRRSELTAAFQLALQPIGHYLRHADPRECDLTLTPKQVTQYKLLETQINTIQPDDKHALSPITPSQTYTMHGIPVTLKIKAPAGASIYLESHGGGKFSNGMAITKITADKNGIATAKWLTQGDSVGPAMISATSPQAGLPIFFEINVIKLQLIKIPSTPKG